MQAARARPPICLLDCRDIARGLATLLVDPPAGSSRFHDVAFTLTGPAALGGAEMAEILSHAAGRKIVWETDAAAYDAHAERLGQGEGPKAIYEQGRQGSFAEVHTDVFEALTGRRPRPFPRFALDYAGHFRARP